MGSSISQVAIGVVCLGAAFVFGSYINNQPPLGNTPTLNSDDPAEGKVDLSELAQKGIEQMPRLQHRVASRASLDELDRQSSSLNQVDLPSPGDLDPRMTRDKPVNQPSAPAPDFSGVAASYEPSPIKSQPLAEMPSVKSPSSSNLKNLANSFQPAEDSEPAVPDFTQKVKAVPIPEIAVDRDFALSKPDVTVETSNPKFDPPSSKNSIAEIAKKFAASPANQTNPSKDVEKTPAASIGSVEVAQGPTGFNTDRPTWMDAETDGERNEISQPQVAQTTVETPPMNSVLESAQQQQNLNAVADQDTNQGWGNRVVSRDRNALSNSGADRVVAQPSFEPVDSAANRSGQRRSIPFKLTDNAKVKLVRLRKVASQNITLQTTKFEKYLVEPGESLQSISTRYFGKPDYYLDIYLANRNKLRNPVEVPPGTVLRIPVYQQ